MLFRSALSVKIEPLSGTPNPSTAMLYAKSGSASTFTAYPMTALGSNLYSVNLPAATCPTTMNYYVSVQTTAGATVTSPSNAPTGTYSVAVATSVVDINVDDFEAATSAWVSGATGDTATTGMWVRGDPIGTAAQPEDDHTPNGTNCFITGNGVVGGAIGAADLDGGIATLTTPSFDGSGDSYVSYWRWYSNNQGSAPGEDSMPVLISNNGGASWVQLELVTENAGAWVQKSFRISDFVTPTANMKLRFVARDLLNGSIVEAAVDDVQVINYDCSVAADINRDGKVDGADLGLLLSGWGQAGATDLNQDGTTNGADLGQLLSAWAP